MKFLLPLIALPFLLFPSTRYFFVYYHRVFNYYYDYVETSFESDIEAENFDFIVVGAGSAGAVVAYRLSQHYKVLLLEAGGDPSGLSSIPGFALDLLGYKEHDWDYKSIPQKNMALSHDNQQISHNRGKVMGGCSTLNYMLYLRGHPLDYDNWANITQDSSWNYENLLPYFKKSIKKYNGQFQENKKHYEGSPYGFLTIEQVKWDKMRKTLLEAGAELGLGTDFDANGPQTSGAKTLEVTQRLGERLSTYAGIFEGKSLKNLRVSKYSHVSKVKLDSSGRAVGVWFYKHGKRHFARASKEVIVSAGAFDSPKLLLLSGIGPTAELKSHGIKPKVNLPVGENLQDHFGAILLSFLTANGTSMMVERDAGLGDFYDYFVHGTGFLTAPTALNGQFFATTSGVKGVDWPDIQALFAPIAPSYFLIDNFGDALSIKKEVFREVITPIHGRDGFTVITLLVRPKSRGQLSLKDKNPFSDPLIDPRPFSHSDDLKALIEGINATLRLVEESNAYKELDAKFNPIPFSQCSSHKFRSDSYWECYVRHTTYAIWHPVGTCKMAHPKDPSAVVDSQLRVLGTRGLRVIDASIMPVIVNANTNAPAILIGEKGASSILEDWASQYLVCNFLEPLLVAYRRKCFYSN